LTQNCSRAQVRQKEQSQGLDANALQNQSAATAAVSQVFDSSQMQMETDPFITARRRPRYFLSCTRSSARSSQESRRVEIRKIGPQSSARMENRNDMTIKVRLGMTGSKAQQFRADDGRGNVKRKWICGGKTNIVGDTQHNTAELSQESCGPQKPEDAFSRDPDAKGTFAKNESYPIHPLRRALIRKSRRWKRAQVEQQTAPKPLREPQAERPAHKAQARSSKAAQNDAVTGKWREETEARTEDCPRSN
jgi:hypothetical protein